jgi:hypothetical protein
MAAPSARLWPSIAAMIWRAPASTHAQITGPGSGRLALARPPQHGARRGGEARKLGHGMPARRRRRIARDERRRARGAARPAGDGGAARVWQIEQGARAGLPICGSGLIGRRRAPEGLAARAGPMAAGGAKPINRGDQPCQAAGQRSARIAAPVSSGRPNTGSMGRARQGADPAHGRHLRRPVHRREHRAGARAVADQHTRQRAARRASHFSDVGDVGGGDIEGARPQAAAGRISSHGSAMCQDRRGDLALRVVVANGRACARPEGAWSPLSANGRPPWRGPAAGRRHGAGA